MELYQAIEDNNLKRVRELLDEGMDPNIQEDYIVDTIQDVRLMTPLMVASSYYNIDRSIIDELLNREANPNIKDDKGMTALRISILYGGGKALDMILNYYTYFISSTTPPFYSLDVDEEGYEGHKMDPLLSLVLDRLNSKKSYPLVKKLLINGANPNLKDTRGYSPLYEAIVNKKNFYKEDEVIIKDLLEYGADPNSMTTSIVYTVLLEILQRTRLLRNIINKIHQDEYTVTTTKQSYATLFDILRLLLQYGANPMLVASSRLESTLRAINNIDIDKFIDPSFSIYGGKKNYDALYICGIFIGININTTNLTNLMLASLEGLYGLVLSLPLNSPFSTLSPLIITDDQGDNTLIYAISGGNILLIKYLLNLFKQDNREEEEGVFINNQNNKGNTALIYISSLDSNSNNSKNFNIALLLLNNPLTKVNLVNNQGRTALHYACQMGNRRLIQLLLIFNASLTIQDQEGLTPLDLLPLSLKDDLEFQRVLYNIPLLPKDIRRTIYPYL